MIEYSKSFLAKLIQSDDRTKRYYSEIKNRLLSYAGVKSRIYVTLDEIKKRVKGFNKQTTYLKVLARGTLDKALTVEADGFSLQAVKMIVLMGGTAIKKSVKK